MCIRDSNTGFNEKNINKKYQWLNKNGLYKDHMDVIKKSEKQLTGFEIKNLNGISNCVVKAVTSKSPRRSYSAPFWMKLVYPVAKRIT